MEKHENTVNSLWIGNLHEMEIVTMRSFINNGAEFNLWVYEEMRHIPSEVNIRDANEILPKEQVFMYPNKMQLGYCGDTVVGFSEHFRYKVLYEHGGWWSDMDVTCLKPLSEIKEPYYFRPHGILPVVGNIIKCPPKSDLMKMCYETTVNEVNNKTDDMFLAIEILCYYIRFLNLRKYIKKGLCNLDYWPKIEKFYVSENIPYPENLHFIHWMSSHLKNYNIHYNKLSAFGKMVEKLYGEIGLVPKAITPQRML